MREFNGDVMLHDECFRLEFATYQENDRTAIMLIDVDGIRYATATVNIGDVVLKDQGSNALIILIKLTVSITKEINYGYT